MDEVFFAPPDVTGGHPEGIRNPGGDGEGEKGGNPPSRRDRSGPNLTTSLLRFATGGRGGEASEEGGDVEGGDPKLHRPSPEGSREWKLLNPKWREKRAPKNAKNILSTIRALGLPTKRIPKQFRDVIVAKSRKGPIGALAVRNHSGLVKNHAYKSVKKFEENVGGRDEVVEKLEAIEPTLPQHLKDLLFVLKANPKKTLAMAMVDVKSEPVALMKYFARACVELAQVQVAIEAHKNLPGVVKELYKHALEGVEGLCRTCGGTGKVKKRRTSTEDELDCPLCGGKGVRIIDSPHKEFAVEKLLEVTKLTEKSGPSINLTTNVGVKVGEGGQAFFEKVVKAADEVLFKRETPHIVDVEAEVVSPAGD